MIAATWVVSILMAMAVLGSTGAVWAHVQDRINARADTAKLNEATRQAQYEFHKSCQREAEVILAEVRDLQSELISLQASGNLHGQNVIEGRLRSAEERQKRLDKRMKSQDSFEPWKCSCGDTNRAEDETCDCGTPHVKTGKEEKEPETIETKLARTLVEAQQTIWDSYAVVNPLRLEIWRELTADDDNAVQEPAESKEEKQQALIEKQAQTIRAYQGQIAKLNRIKADVKPVEDGEHTLHVQQVNKKLSERNHELAQDLIKARKENETLTTRNEHLITDNTRLHERLGDVPLEMWGEKHPVRWSPNPRTHRPHEGQW